MGFELYQCSTKHLENYFFIQVVLLPEYSFLTSLTGTDSH